MKIPQGALTPGKSCFVYGHNGDGSATSTYASNSPFPTSVETFVSGLFPLSNITVPTFSQTAGGAGVTSGAPQVTSNTGITSTSSSMTAGASQVTSNIGTMSSSSSITSSSATTVQSTAAAQRGTAGRNWPMAAKVLRLRV